MLLFSFSYVNQDFIHFYFFTVSSSLFTVVVKRITVFTVFVKLSRHLVG